MCGRYTLSTQAERIAEYFELDTPPSLAPRYNIAPSQEVPIVRQVNHHRHLDMVRWGLVPSWAKDLKIGYKMINARAETVAEKPAYRAAFQRRRCLVVADGFYEWSPMNGKQPYWIGLQDHAPLAFAGLWEHWDDKGTGEHIESCTIIVTDANQQMSAIHHRMPVILPKQSWREWLDPNLHTPEPLQELLLPYAGELLSYPVSRNVNSPKNDFKELMEPLVGNEGVG